MRRENSFSTQVEFIRSKDGIYNSIHDYKPSKPYQQKDYVIDLDFGYVI